MVSDNFQDIALSIFDYYHTLNNPPASLRMIEPHPFVVQFVRRPEFSDRGMVLAGIHMSNFDMAFQMGGLAGVKALSITLPDFNSAYQKQYDMRLKSGMNVVPASFGSIKYAVSHLRAGGAVITAVDRPDASSAYRPKFFGLPAMLPVHHIFIALKAHVPIIVGAIQKQNDGKYHFFFSEPMEMESHPDRHEEILLNAERVLHVAENLIRQNPNQWSMTFPVWPEALSQVPD
jgi:KDO2-lipid IV(A) lauroyltransferase